MRGLVLVLVLAVVSLILWSRTHTNAWTKTHGPASTAGEAANGSATTSKSTTRVDFPTQVKPVLQAKCQPCHFSGGKVYAQMPFDRPETIKTLGTKLFTRIKDENERRLIREFLEQE